MKLIIVISLGNSRKNEIEVMFTILKVYASKFRQYAIQYVLEFFKQSTGARNRVGIGLSYRPTRQATQAGGIVSLKWILGLLKRLHIRALYGIPFLQVPTCIIYNMRKRASSEWKGYNKLFFSPVVTGLGTGIQNYRYCTKFISKRTTHLYYMFLPDF